MDNGAENKFQLLRMHFGRLKAIAEFAASESSVQPSTVNDYNSIVDSIGGLLERDFANLKITVQYFRSIGGAIMLKDEFNPKIMQMIRALEYGYNLGESVVQIGSIYNAINDAELKSRCSDILTAAGNFDRVINQASQVLEDRIRTKSGLNNLIGVDLVNKAINPDPVKSVLQIDASKEEHEGIHYLCKGIMLAFRNPTHHRLSDKYKREDALKFCGFIDDLLKTIDESKKK